MDLFGYIHQNRGELAFLAIQHVQLVLLSVTFSTLAALLLAAVSERVPAVRSVLLSATGTMLTIPSYALFALLIPVMGLGVWPTISALAIYGVYPILRNTLAGIDGVDPNVIDAARGLGMGQRRLARSVVLPLAWPVVLNGIRTATIMLVATAAIGAVVHGPGLGTLIFEGLERLGGANALEEALSGVIGIALVALVLDLLFVVVGRLTRVRGLHA